MAATQVLDSYALLALLRDEPGAEIVAGLLERAGQQNRSVHMTEVNYAEVQYTIRRKDGETVWASIAGQLLAAPIEFHAADRRLADVAAGFKSRFKISLADAFAAALAKERKAELVTADPEFRALDKEIKIRWLA